MASKPTSSVAAVVVDASVVIALCAREPDKIASAEEKLAEYAADGSKFFAPGGLIMECLYVFCKKLKDGVLTPIEHAAAVHALITFMAAVDPPPSGDKALIARAESIRGSLGCSRSADSIYLALADELGKICSTEVVTFDTGMKKQAHLASILCEVVELAIV